MHTEFARGQMITQQVRAWEVLDERVLQAMRTMPRERFVPERFRELAFADTPIAIGHRQHMLAPSVLGRMVQALLPLEGVRALQIGAGTGYATACLATLGAQVRALEIHADLAAVASANLARHASGTTEVVTADAFKADLGSEHDVIAVTGSVPLLEDRWQRALKIGGRLFIVVGEPPLQEARLITRMSANEWHCEVLFETVIDTLENAPRREPFSF